jgi:Zn-dependent protease
MARQTIRLLPGEYRPDWAPAAPGGISPIFLALVAGFAASGVALYQGYGNAKVGVFLFVFCGWMITLCLHEFMHALTAYRGGDGAVKGRGYLRLDPLRYGHPLLTFILPLIFLFLNGIPLPGGAVLIETERVQGRLRKSLVSAAGPAINVVAAAILLAVIKAAAPAAILSPEDQPQGAFWAGMTLLAYLQVATAILNLIPVPGLDGYGIIEPWLSPKAREAGRQIMPFGLLIVFALLFTVPQTRDWFTEGAQRVMDAFDTPAYGVYWGFAMFKFWS